MDAALVKQRGAMHQAGCPGWLLSQFKRGDTSTMCIGMLQFLGYTA